MKSFPILAVLAAVLASCVAASVVAAGNTKRDQPQGVHITQLSHGTIGSRVDANTNGIVVKTKGPRDILFTSITVDPGGSFGWHSHPGPVLVAVSKGTLAVYHTMGSHCMRSTVAAGEAFVENGGDVHTARNEGSTPVELNATFLGPKGTTEYLNPKPQPKGCDVS